METLTCKCGNKYSKDSWAYDFLKSRGVCEHCYQDQKGIVPSQGHYVPWDYRFNAEPSGDVPCNPEHYEDVFASLPIIKWSEKYKKWKVTFISPDFGGYDTIEITWYFNNKEDIIKLMIKE